MLRLGPEPCRYSRNALAGRDSPAPPPTQLAFPARTLSNADALLSHRCEIALDHRQGEVGGLARGVRDSEWASVALAVGFYDQARMIHRD